MENKVIKVLDLFAGTQSVKKALDQLGGAYEYKAIDIYSPNIILDLSQDEIVDKLKKKLGDWRPDFIWASPLCTPFSRATSIKGGTLPFVVKDGKVRLRKHEEFWGITHKAYAHLVMEQSFRNKHINLGKLGLKLFENTFEIVKHFKVPFVIENPAMAVSNKLEFIQTLEKNNTAYCRYGFDYKKSTNFYSKHKLELKKCNHSNHAKVMSGHPSKTGIKGTSGSNKDRSKVPPELIVEILKQILKGE